MSSVIGKRDSALSKRSRDVSGPAVLQEHPEHDRRRGESSVHVEGRVEMSCRPDGCPHREARDRDLLARKTSSPPRLLQVHRRRIGQRPARGIDIHLRAALAQAIHRTDRLQAYKRVIVHRVRLVLALVLVAGAVIETGCASDSPRTVSGQRAGCPKSQRASCGQLIVRQRYVGGLLAEGAVAELRLTGARGATITLDNLQASRANAALLAGHYTLHGAVRPCDANCSHLDPAIRCVGRLQIAARQTSTATVAVLARRGLRCRITTTPPRQNSPA